MTLLRDGVHEVLSVRTIEEKKEEAE